MKILCTGDIHIGRRPSRLPSHVDCGSLSCGAAWGRIVDLAIRESVDLVAVSGDLVDRANRFYEAAGPVEQGLRRLEQAGILTVMVAGNHDYDTLPWLVDGLGPSVRLLGRHGTWERFTFERTGEVLHIDGWSFPSGRVSQSPMETYPFSADGSPVLGLLHADLDQPNSPYAPVALAELRARPITLWLLGHLHAPRLLEEPGHAAVLYPGSPQAMDPGEEGAHGVWIVELGSGQTSTSRMVPLSGVRYDRVQVDVEGVVEGGAIDSRVVGAVRDHLQRVAEEGGSLRYLSCRVRVTGRTALHRGLNERLDELCGELELVHGDVRAVVERVEVHTAPARDLAAIATGTGAPAVLARLIHALQSGSPGAEHEPLLQRAGQLAEEVRRARPYLVLEPDAEPDAELTTAIHDRAALLLDELLSQKEGIA